jgi:hypothetical protein
LGLGGSASGGRLLLLLAVDSDSLKVVSQQLKLMVDVNTIGG